MDSNTVTLIIGLAGISGTIIASILGLYFTARARSAPLREMLYAKQVELITQIIYKQGRFRNYVLVLSGKEPNFKDLARDDIGKCVKEYSEMTEKAAAILPTELWVEIRKLNDFMVDLIIEYDDNATIDEKSLSKFASMHTKVALISRVVLGIDELTGESIKLFTSIKNFDTVTNIKPEYIEYLAKKKRQKTHTKP